MIKTTLRVPRARAHRSPPRHPLERCPPKKPLNGARYNYCSAYVTTPLRNYCEPTNQPATHQPGPGDHPFNQRAPMQPVANGAAPRAALWAGIEEQRPLTKFIRVNSRRRNFGHLQLVDAIAPCRRLTVCAPNRLAPFDSRSRFSIRNVSTLATRGVRCCMATRRPPAEWFILWFI